jgi:hypothetical protein
MGILNPLGHFDMYPDGGQDQPGCGILNAACSHDRAIYLFAESIQSRSLVATKCENWQMYLLGECLHGEQADIQVSSGNPKHGNYFLKTNANSLYGQG